MTLTIHLQGDNISVFNNDAGYVTAADVPAAPGNGVLTLKLFGQAGDNQTGTFTANQGSNTTITLPQIDYNNLVNRPSIPSVNNGQIRIDGGMVLQLLVVMQPLTSLEILLVP